MLMYVGQLFKWKNPEFLIDALAELRRDDILLVFVGGHPDDIKRLQNYAKFKNVRNLVIFLDQVEPSEVPFILKLSDILLHPPYNEKQGTLPLKIFEYMLAERPIVAPRTPAITEVLVDNVNALLYNRHDPKDMAVKITLLLNNPQLARKIARHAWEDALNKYTYRMRALKIIQLLN